MASEGTTFVIDPEFAFYGPMGFDVGALMSNLLMSYFSQAETNGPEFAEWVLSQLISLHESFTQKFLALWDSSSSSSSSPPPSSASAGGEHFRAAVFSSRALVTAAQQGYMAALWTDSLGFAGAKMIRRIVGIAHVADLESIADADARAACEKKCLHLARAMVLASSTSSSASASAQVFPNIHALAARAREIYAAPAPATLAA